MDKTNCFRQLAKFILTVSSSSEEYVIRDTHMHIHLRLYLYAKVCMLTNKPIGLTAADICR